MHYCCCQLAGIVNESLKPCLPQENGKKNLIFPIAKIAKRQNGKNGTLNFLPHLHLLVDQGEEALFLRAKHLGGPFFFGFSRPFGQGEYPLLGIAAAAAVSRGHYSFRFFIRLTWRKTEGGKRVGGIIIHSCTRILSFPHFLYPLEKYRPSQQGSSPLPPADDQSIMRAPPYVHTFCLFHRTARLKTNNILAAVVL